jgi:molybdate transport system substrate-binding protein
MLRRMLRLAAVALASLSLLAAGCAGGDDQLTVSAAASLKKALTSYDSQARYSFAGSDELAAQIRKGARPDVFASANTKLPDELYAAGLVEKPVVFAGNRLVLAVPASGGKVSSLKDVETPGLKLAIGSESVPIGSYTRTVLGKLPEADASAILENVRTEEPDVAGIVGKLTQGAVDAGFVYVSDVKGAGGKLKAIDLPDSLQPTVAYGAAVVKDSENQDAAKKFIDGLMSGDGRAQLEAAGFLPPPAQ